MLPLYWSSNFFNWIQLYVSVKINCTSFAGNFIFSTSQRFPLEWDTSRRQSTTERLFQVQFTGFKIPTRHVHISSYEVPSLPETNMRSEGSGNVTCGKICTSPLLITLLVQMTFALGKQFDQNFLNAFSEILSLLHKK